MSFHLIPQVYAATTWRPDCVGNTAVSNNVVSIQGITCLIEGILAPIPSLLALTAVVMVIISGVKLIGAGAEPKAYAAAWATFTYAIIGLVLMSAIWLILVAIKNFTGVDILNFGF